MPALNLGLIAAATTKAQNVAYFATAISPTQGATSTSPNMMVVTVSGTAVDIQVTLDNGTTWVKLIAALTANTLTTSKFIAQTTDQINFRTANASGITLDLFRLDQISGPASF